jgi:hypothetical protein
MIKQAKLFFEEGGWMALFILVFLLLIALTSGGTTEEEIEMMHFEEEIRDDILMNLYQYDDFYSEMEDQIRIMKEREELEEYLETVLETNVTILYE